MKTDDEIRDVYSKYSLRLGFYDELESFLDARRNYLSGKAQHADVLFNYDIIYTSLKAMWVGNRISQEDFWKLTGMIGEDLG